MQTEPSSPLPDSSETLAQLVRRLLLTQGQRYLSPTERRMILDLGPQAVPPLIAVLADESLQPEDSPGDGYARERAATLLGEISATEALDTIREGDGLTATHEALREALPCLSPAVLEPLLAAFEGSMDRDVRFSVASGSRRLVPRRLRRPGCAARAELGSLRAMRGHEIDAARQSRDRRVVCSNRRSRRCATPPEETKREQVEALRESDRAAIFGTSAQRTKVGRNDPCPCFAPTET